MDCPVVLPIVLLFLPTGMFVYPRERFSKEWSPFIWVGLIGGRGDGWYLLVGCDGLMGCMIEDRLYNRPLLES